MGISSVCIYNILTVRISQQEIIESERETKSSLSRSPAPVRDRWDTEDRQKGPLECSPMVTNNNKKKPGQTTSSGGPRVRGERVVHKKKKATRKKPTKKAPKK